MAFASLLASLTYVTMNQLDTAFFVDESATILVASVLRFAAIRWDIRTPVPFDLVRRVNPGPPPPEPPAPG